MNLRPIYVKGSENDSIDEKDSLLRTLGLSPEKIKPIQPNTHITKVKEKKCVHTSALIVNSIKTKCIG
jgi:hypothetical protein